MRLVRSSSSSLCFRSAARNTFYLKKVGVTHVLNTAEGQTSGTVDTNQKFYKPFNIKYKGLKLLDVSQANISIHFTEISDFIEEGLGGGGKVKDHIYRMVIVEGCCTMTRSSSLGANCSLVDTKV